MIPKTRRIHVSKMPFDFQYFPWETVRYVHLVRIKPQRNNLSLRVAVKKHGEEMIESNKEWVHLLNKSLDIWKILENILVDLRI